MSIVASIIIMVILSLIAISFARIMRQEQQQALERQLTTQAYYAAETAVNDVRQEINQKLLARQTAGVSIGFEGWVRDVDGIVSYSDEDPTNDPDNTSRQLPPDKRGFGSAIAMSGPNLMAVSLTPPIGTFNPNYTISQVHIYKKISGSWTKVFRIFDNPGVDIDADPVNGVVGTLGVSGVSIRFGEALAFSPNGTLAVGDPTNDAVHIFQENGDNWVRNDDASSDLTRPISNPTIDPEHGAAIAFAGSNTVVIGIGSCCAVAGAANRKVLLYVRDPATDRWSRPPSATHTRTLPTNPCYPTTITTVPSSYNHGNQCPTNHVQHTHVVRAIAANSDFIAVFPDTVPGHVHLYRRNGNRWLPWRILPTLGNYPTGLSVNAGSLSNNNLMLAMSNQSNSLSNTIVVHRYDSNTDQWSRVPQAVTQGLLQGLSSNAWIHIGYGSALAFGGPYNLAVGGESLQANLTFQGHGIVALHTYELPITETSVLGENQEECQVATGPLSERFLDDDQTVEYTCVLINTRPDLLVYDRISTERSLVVHLQPIDASTGADVTLTDLYVWWQTTAPTSNTVVTPPPISFTGFDQTKIFPARGGWDRSAPVLMVQLIPLPDGNYARDYLRQNTKTFFLYPSGTNTETDTTTAAGLVVWSPPDPSSPLTETISGEIVEGYCHEDSRNYHSKGDTNNGTVASKRHCGVRISSLVPTATSPRHTYIMRLLSIYEPSAVTVEGFSNTTRVVFKDIQVVVDATARAGHVLRRIQERLPLIYVYDYPEYVLDIAEDICKDIESEPNEITRGRVENVLRTNISSCASLFP